MPPIRMAGREKTTIEWIPLSEMFVDMSYQRPLSEAWLKERGKDAEPGYEFDPDALGLPLVSERVGRGGKRYATIDGQHRAELVRRELGDDQLIQVEVVRGVTVEWEAKEFERRNTNRKPRLIDMFLAQVRSGKPMAVEITAVLKGLGLKVDRMDNQNVVQCVKVLQRIYQEAEGSTKPLRRALAICKEAWSGWEDAKGVKGRDAFLGDNVLGIGLLCLRHGEQLDSGELIRKLQATGGPVQLLGKARNRRETNGGSVAHNVATVITLLYNKGRRTDLLPPWKQDAED